MAYMNDMNPNGVINFLTVSEAAKFLNVHANTLRRWNNLGLIPSYRISARGDR